MLASGHNGAGSLDGIRQLYESLWVSLKILVWGPGETGNKQWFEVRKNVVDTLKANSNQQDEVYTSEDIFRVVGEPIIEYGYAEIVHAQWADVIIALVMASTTRQGGVYRELELIAPHEELRDKAWIFMIKNKTYLARFQAGALDRYMEHQKNPMSGADLKGQRLIEACVARVEDVRKQRMYKRYDARLASSGARIAQ